LTECSRRERRALLTASEERLRNIEGKGPGLATVSAVIVAVILLAIAGGWRESTEVVAESAAEAAMLNDLRNFRLATCSMPPAESSVTHSCSS
jgi:hypothetical protein